MNTNTMKGTQLSKFNLNTDIIVKRETTINRNPDTYLWMKSQYHRIKRSIIKYELDDNQIWPGFSIQSENDYKQIGVFHNGKERNILEHRANWILNVCDIDRYDVIHHINGIQTDNNIENLALLTLDEHRRYHNINKGDDVNYLTLLEFYEDNEYTDEEIRFYMPLYNLLEIEEIDE